jgi:hypothetical protein
MRALVDSPIAPQKVRRCSRRRTRMRHPAHALRQAFWIVCACVLLLPRVAAAQPSRGPDFDGDGRRDRFTVDRREPSVVRVWLSASGTTELIRTRGPVLQVVVTDLDGDHRQELVARGGESRIHVWTHTRTGFRSYRRRHLDAGAIFQPNHRRLADDDSERPGVINNVTFVAFALRLCASPRAPDLEASIAPAPHPAPADRSAPTIDPFAPRPPPTHIPG